MKKAAPSGITAKKIIVRPCIVKIWLYWSAVRNVCSGRASWMRMRSASAPPTRKKKKAVMKYMMPIFLWSTVVSQLHLPVSAVGRRNTLLRVCGDRGATTLMDALRYFRVAR